MKPIVHTPTNQEIIRLSNMGFYVGHFKQTTPNTHSGERVHSRTPSWAAIDAVNMTALLLTEEEKEIMEGTLWEETMLISDVHEEIFRCRGARNSLPLGI